jgi:hypothetical protein
MRKRARRQPVKVRFWAKVEVPVTDDGCWLWTGALDRGGYASLRWRGKRTRAHRTAYQLFVGELPPGLHVDHLCRARHCVRPDHLEPVTPAENIRRGLTGKHQSGRTHCLNGHEYTDANTYRYGLSRYCRTCNREQKQRRKAREIARLKGESA